MSERFVGRLNLTPEQASLGLLRYDQVPYGVIFVYRDTLFLKVLLQPRGMMSFGVKDGLLMSIDDSELVVLFSGTFSVNLKLEQADTP
jgi:hypothetical protein